MEAIWQSTQAFLQQAPWLIPLVIALVAMIESFAVLGIIVPGVVMLFGLSFLAAEVDIPLLYLLASAAIGAVLGDGSSFLIGRHFTDRIWHWRWLTPHQRGLNRAKYFINHSGSVSIVIGRFIGALRPLMPITAGALGMRLRLFFALDTLSVLLWAPAYILPGWLAEKSMEFDMTMLTNLSGPQFYLLLSAITLVLMALWVILDLYSRDYKYWTSTTRHLTAGALCALVAGLLIWQKPWTLDLIANQHDIGRTYWADFWLHLNLLSQPELLNAIVGTTIMLLLIQSKRLVALFMLLAWVVGIALTEWLQQTLALGRPDSLHIALQQFSSPAIGSAGITALLVWLFDIQTRHSRRQSALLTTATWVTVMLAASAPAVVGLHWLSDTLTGAFIGASLAHLLLFACKRFSERLDDVDWAPIWLVIGLTIYAHQLAAALIYKYHYASLMLTH